MKDLNRQCNLVTAEHAHNPIDFRSFAALLVDSGEHRCSSVA